MATWRDWTATQSLVVRGNLVTSHSYESFWSRLPWSWMSWGWSPCLWLFSIWVFPCHQVFLLYFSTQWCLAFASRSVLSGPDFFFIFFNLASHRTVGIEYQDPSSNTEYSPIRASREQFFPLVCLLVFSVAFRLLLGYGWRFLSGVSPNIFQWFFLLLETLECI